MKYGERSKIAIGIVGSMLGLASLLLPWSEAEIGDSGTSVLSSNLVDLLLHSVNAAAIFGAVLFMVGTVICFSTSFGVFAQLTGLITLAPNILDLPSLVPEYGHFDLSHVHYGLGFFIATFSALIELYVLVYFWWWMEQAEA
ncbi:MAG: hypothetical protein SA339_11135 [Methanomassiliicoccus sp.]|nr:hypothetical protein [Methanomassiliicoccus sp.]